MLQRRTKAEEVKNDNSIFFSPRHFLLTTIFFEKFFFFSFLLHASAKSKSQAGAAVWNLIQEKTAKTEKYREDAAKRKRENGEKDKEDKQKNREKKH